MQVATNGALSLGDDFSTVTSVPFPLASSAEPLIAPFFADVDTRGVGAIYYRLTTNTTDIEFANEQIRHAFAHAYPSFSASQVVVATWDSVGYFREQSDKVIIKTQMHWHQ